MNAIGYCVGGTLLAVTLAHMAAKRDQRIASATFFASQVDFTYSGDLKVFADEEQIAIIERQMKERGYLDSRKMANSFNLMRSNDLIWPYVINNYFKGKEPMAFDLLYWNSDATRMPAANHSFYLRNCYLENNLSQGKMVIARPKARSRQGQGADLQSRHPRGSHRAGKVGAARLEIFRRAGALRAGGLRPHRGRGQPAGEAEVPILDRPQAHGRRPRQMARARRPSTRAPGGPTGSPGSRRRTRTLVKARKPGGGKLKPIEDAPGSYVKVRD